MQVVRANRLRNSARSQQSEFDQMNELQKGGSSGPEWWLSFFRIGGSAAPEYSAGALKKMPTRNGVPQGGKSTVVLEVLKAKRRHLLPAKTSMWNRRFFFNLLVCDIQRLYLC